MLYPTEIQMAASLFITAFPLYYYRGMSIERTQSKGKNTSRTTTPPLMVFCLVFSHKSKSLSATIYLLRYSHHPSRNPTEGIINPPHIHTYLPPFCCTVFVHSAHLCPADCKSIRLSASGCQITLCCVKNKQR